MKAARSIDELSKKLRHLSADLSDDDRELGLLIYQAAKVIEDQQRYMLDLFMIFKTANTFILSLWPGEVLKGSNPPRHINDKASTALNLLTERVASMTWEIADREMKVSKGKELLNDSHE